MVGECQTVMHRGECPEDEAPYDLQYAFFVIKIENKNGFLIRKVNSLNSGTLFEARETVLLSQDVYFPSWFLNMFFLFQFNVEPCLLLNNRNFISSVLNKGLSHSRVLELLHRIC